MTKRITKKWLLHILLCICFIFAAIGMMKVNAAKVYAADSDFVISNGVLTGYTGSAIVVKVPEGVKHDTTAGHFPPAGA